MKRALMFALAMVFMVSLSGCGMFKCLQKPEPVQEKVVAPVKVEQPVKPAAPAPKKDRN